MFVLCIEWVCGEPCPLERHVEIIHSRMKLLAALVVPLVGARVVRYEQFPILGHKEVEYTAKPAVGVHFTNSYATAAAKYENGTTVDLVRVRYPVRCQSFVR